MQRFLYLSYFIFWPLTAFPLILIKNTNLIIILVSVFVVAFIASYPKIQGLLEADLTKKFGYLMPYPPYITDRIKSMKRNNLIMLGISYLFGAYLPFRFKHFDWPFWLISGYIYFTGMACGIFAGINQGKYRILKKNAEQESP